MYNLVLYNGFFQYHVLLPELFSIFHLALKSGLQISFLNLIFFFFWRQRFFLLHFFWHRWFSDQKNRNILYIIHKIVPKHIFRCRSIFQDSLIDGTASCYLANCLPNNQLQFAVIMLSSGRNRNKSKSPAELRVKIKINFSSAMTSS